MSESADGQLDHRIADAERFQAPQIADHRKTQCPERNGGIDADFGLKVLGPQAFPCQIVDALAEGFQARRIDGQASGHGVPSMLFQQVGAVPQGRRQIESRNAPARPAPDGSVTTEDQGWSVEFAQHSRGDDADDADVPRGISFDDHQITLRVEPVSHPFQGFLGDAFLDVLPLAVLLVEHFGQALGLSLAVAKQQSQGVFSGFQASGGVEARPKLESHFIDPHGAAGSGHPLQRLQAKPGGGIEPFETCMHQDPVLANQGDQVGDGAQRHQVEQRFEIVGVEAAESGLTSVFDQGVGQLEGQTR